MKERRIHFDYETKPVSVKKNGLSLWKVVLFVIVLYSISKAIANGIIRANIGLGYIGRLLVLFLLLCSNYTISIHLNNI